MSPTFRSSKEFQIAVLAMAGICAHVLLRAFFSVGSAHFVLWPLYAVLLLGGVPLTWELMTKAFRGQFGSDLLAGISIVTSVLLGEYLAGSLVVLMLSGGEALERYAVARASSVLAALAKRMPSIAHRKSESGLVDIELEAVRVGDMLVVYPHDICPVDGIVVEGHSVMDESYLTGEPYEMSKTPGSHVISGAVNGHSALTIKAEKLPVDSRYSKIMQVMRETEKNRPQLRRLGDQLGAWYTPLAVFIALAAWQLSGDPIRFLAVLVVATPCPLLIAIPVAIIGSISLCAKRGIIVKNPAILEQIDRCRTIIFDKTGTLTYGEPALTEELCAPGFERDEVLRLVASVEQYSKHPLGSPVVRASAQRGVSLLVAEAIEELPGQGLTGRVRGRSVEVTSRSKVLARKLVSPEVLPDQDVGLECLIVIDGKYAATYRFRDAVRKDSLSFIQHLAPKHKLTRTLLVSGDRESEVRYLAERVGIEEVHFSKSPEEKVEIVRAEVKKAPTLFLGDGINDAPALMIATVGIAFGQNSDITTEAAGAVIMDTTLGKVDELFHISRRMRFIALQSAVGGMLLSILGMLIAARGHLPPVAGALAQEFIDLAAVLNALRAAVPPESLTDYENL